MDLLLKDLAYKVEFFVTPGQFQRLKDEGCCTGWGKESKPPEATIHVSVPARLVQYDVRTRQFECCYVEDDPFVALIKLIKKGCEQTK